MFSISDYLNKFKNLIPPERSVKQAVVLSINSVIDIDIPFSKIKISRDKIFIDTHSVVKNEIFLNKEKIIKEIYKNLPNKKINDIR